MISRFDYSRLREYRFVAFGLLIAANIVVYGMPEVNGATRWIPLPFLEFQPSEFGKLLLIISLAAFAVSRGRGLYERSTTARIMLLALIAAMIVIPQPDIGTGLVYVTIGVAVLYFGGTSWKQLTALAVLFLTAIVMVLAVAPAFGVHVLAVLPVRAPDDLPAPTAHLRDPRSRPATSCSSPRSRSAPVRRPGSAPPAPRRPSSTSSPRTRTTSSSRSSGRRTGSSARRWCCRCTRS